MDYDVVKRNNKFIFFLHGWGADKTSFSWLKNYIDDVSLVFISFSGFGKSPPPNKAYAVYDYVCEIKDLITKISSGEKVDIVCHSFGFRVAGMLAAMNPELVDKLFIIDGAGLKPKRGLKYRLKVLKYKRLKRKVKRNKISPEKLKKFGSVDYKALEGVMKQTFVKVVNEDLTKYFKQIKCDTFIFWGKKDSDTPLKMAKKLNKIIKNSKLYISKNSGHFSFLEDKDSFIYWLNKFLFQNV